jgi:hypothetical protein
LVSLPSVELSFPQLLPFQAFVRFFNADLKYMEVLNSYFTKNLSKNEAIVSEFAASGKIFDADEDKDGYV